MCTHVSESISLKQIIKLNKNQKFSNFLNVPKIPKGAVNVEITQLGHFGDGNFMGELRNYHHKFVKDAYIWELIHVSCFS